MKAKNSPVGCPQLKRCLHHRNSSNKFGKTTAKRSQTVQRKGEVILQEVVEKALDFDCRHLLAVSLVSMALGQTGFHSIFPSQCGA